MSTHPPTLLGCPTRPQPRDGQPALQGGALRGTQAGLGGAGPCLLGRKQVLGSGPMAGLRALCFTCTRSAGRSALTESTSPSGSGSGWTEGSWQHRGPSHTGRAAGSLVGLRGDRLDARPTGWLCGGPRCPCGRVPSPVPWAGSVEALGPPSSWARPVTAVQPHVPSLAAVLRSTGRRSSTFHSQSAPHGAGIHPMHLHTLM